MKRIISLLSITALFLGIISCDEEDKKLNINGPAPQTSQVSDITFYTADITGKLDLTEDELSQSEFGFFISKTNDVKALNSDKYPIKEFGSDYSYTLSLSRLDSLTTYYYRSYIYYKGDYIYSDIQSFTTKAPKDIIITGDLGNDSCTIVSKIESQNLRKHINTYGICYGINTNPDGFMDLSVIADTIKDDMSFTTRLWNIPFDTLVHYRAFVSIAGKLYYGPEYSFQGNSIETGPINLSDYSVTSKLKILDDGYKRYGVCYGANSNLNLYDFHTQAVWTDSISANKQFKLQLLNVPFDSVVYYRAVVESNGLCYYGNIKSFDGNSVTTGLIDTVTLQVSSYIKIANGISQFGVCYSTSENPTINDQTVYTRTLNIENGYTLTLTNIPFGTVYYRSFVMRGAEVTYGDIYHFEGNKIITGDFTTENASVKSSIKYSDGYESLSAGICYSLNENPTVNDISLQADINDTDNSFEVVFTRIPFGMVYYRAYTIINGNIIYGDIKSFEGNSITVGDIESNYVESHIKFADGYDNIKFGVCYGLYEDLTTDDRCALVDRIDDNNNFTVQINHDYLYGLTDVNWLYGTVYYRAFVTIDNVTYYSDIKSYKEPMPTGEEVDLGLSVKWASFNVGATKQEQAGYYYAWGETTPKRNYSWNNYKFWISGSSDSSNVIISKYNTLSKYGDVDYKKVLEANDDVAHVQWGGNWRMPTIAEYQELINNCTWTRVRNGNINGYTITSNKEGYTDKSIFIPFTNAQPVLYYEDSYISHTGSSSLPERGPLTGGSLYINEDGIMMDMGIFAGTCMRFKGQAVRPVTTSTTWAGITTMSLNIDQLTLRIGEDYRDFEITVKSDTCDYSYFPITWSSSAPGTVTVSDKGYVTALASGTAIITATCLGKTASCTVTVKEYVPVKEYVDLGLSVKWATCNVGAEKPEEYGFYYAWGETKTKIDYSYDTYKWYDKTNGFTKYIDTKRPQMDGSTYSGIVDGKRVLDLEDDAAYVIYGEGWRMPTIQEINELIENCTWNWTTLNGVYGYEIKSKTNDNSIFLPAAGYHDGLIYYNKDQYSEKPDSYRGYYSSSNLDSSLPAPTPCLANALYFASSIYTTEFNTQSRNSGYSIRPVYP